MIPLCCGFLAAPIPERADSLMFLSLCCFFTKYIMLDARCEKETSPRTGAHTKHCHSFFSLSSCTCPLFFPFLHRLFISLFRLAHPSSQTLLKLPFYSRNKSAVNALLLSFFPLLVGRSFQGNRFLLWPGFCQGLIGLLGTERTKAQVLALNGGGRLSGCGGGNQFSLRITPQFHMCLSVGISR